MSWWLVVVGYFAGSIPFGVIVTTLATRKDVRSEGSGNIGATNVARVAGKGWGALVLLLDAAKGALPVLWALHVAPDDQVLHVSVAIAAFAGHVFPVWLKFKGGKGVATALGVLLVLLPWAALIGFVIWIAVLLTLRISSVGSLLGAIAAIIASFVLKSPVPYIVLAIALFVAMLLTHRGNIERLIKRNENRV